MTTRGGEKKIKVRNLSTKLKYLKKVYNVFNLFYATSGQLQRKSDNVGARGLPSPSSYLALIQFNKTILSLNIS